MFFKHKKQNDLYGQLEGQIATLVQDTAAIRQQLEGFGQFKDNTAQAISQLENNMGHILGQMQGSVGQNLGQVNQNLGQLEDQFHQLRTDVHKHDMALEDLLDEWAEKKSDEESVNARLKEASQTERLLLDLFEAYLEQFWSLKHYASSKDDAWAAQIDLMEQNLERSRRCCGISLIQERGVSIDYGLHDVIEAVDTKDPALDKTVAEVYRCGYLYQGKTKKKAQVAAYRYSRETS